MPFARIDGRKVVAGFERHTVKGSGTDGENTAQIDWPDGTIEWTIKNAGAASVQLGHTLARAEGAEYLAVATGASFDGSSEGSIFVYNPNVADNVIEIYYARAAVSAAALTITDA